MSQAELRRLAEKELAEYGVARNQFSMVQAPVGNGSCLKVKWTHNGQDYEVYLPKEAGNKHEVDIFRKRLAGKMQRQEMQLTSNNKEIAMDVVKLLMDQLKRLEKQVLGASEEISGLSDMMLDLNGGLERRISELETWRKNFTAILSPSMVTVPPVEQPIPPTSQYPKIAQPLAAPQQKIQAVSVCNEPSKSGKSKQGLQALAEWKKNLSARAKVAATNSKHTPEMRILRFLDEIGQDASVAEMRAAGLVGDDGTPHSLETLLAEMDIGRGLLEFFEDDETSEEVYELTEKARELLQETDRVAAAPKIEPQLEEAEETPKVVVAPKPVRPVLTLAPKPEPIAAQNGRRVLQAMPKLNIPNLALSLPDKALLALMERDMTITDLQEAIGHTSSWKSLANNLYKREKEDGHLRYLYEAGDKKYAITDKGRAYINGLLKAHRINSTQH